jgi:hypothetical protein
VRKRAVLVTVVAVCVGGAAFGFGGRGQEKPLKVESLAFMTGAWERTEGGVKMEEHWTAPLGGCMLGMFRQVNGERKLREFEIIEETPEGVVMTIKHFTPDLKEIEGRALVRKLVKATDSEAVFEATTEEMKPKITYKRDGSTLNAKVELVRQGKLVTLDIPFTRMAAK